MTPAENPRRMRMAFSFASAPSFGKEEGIDVAGCDLCKLHAQARAHFGGHERIGIGKRRGLAPELLESLARHHVRC